MFPHPGPGTRTRTPSGCPVVPMEGVGWNKAPGQTQHHQQNPIGVGAAAPSFHTPAGGETKQDECRTDGVGRENTGGKGKTNKKESEKLKKEQKIIKGKGKENK